MNKNLSLPASPRWVKSTRSGPVSDNCVELAAIEGGVAMRDSKNPDAGTQLYTAAEFRAFIEGAKLGEFDGLI